jgi:hypothetical protein
MRRDGERTVIVAMHFNDDGILYEDDRALSIAGPVDALELGREVVQALNKTSLRPRDLRHYKLADWPAYGASGASSVRRFEAEYIQLSVESANDANVVYVITGSPSRDSHLQVKTSVSSACSPEELGNRALEVYCACRDRKL